MPKNKIGTLNLINSKIFDGTAPFMYVVKGTIDALYLVKLSINLLLAKTPCR